MTKNLSSEPKAALRGHGPIFHRFIERALCEHAKYWAYAREERSTLWAKRPKRTNSLGFVKLDGSLKSREERAKISPSKVRPNAGSESRIKSPGEIKKLRRYGNKGGHCSGFRTRLGVSKPIKVMDAIKKQKSEAGSASGACKARLCKKCGKGNRAFVHILGRCKFKS